MWFAPCSLLLKESLSGIKSPWRQQALYRTGRRPGTPPIVAHLHKPVPPHTLSPPFPPPALKVRCQSRAGLLLLNISYKSCKLTGRPTGSHKLSHSPKLNQPPSSGQHQSNRSNIHHLCNLCSLTPPDTSQQLTAVAMLLCPTALPAPLGCGPSEQSSSTAGCPEHHR